MTNLNQFSIKSLYMLSVVVNSKDLQTAAVELCISPSALSHQMQRLEEKVGRKLFTKEGRHQKLLPDAKEWAQSLSRSFLSIENDTNQFIGNTNKQINIGVSSALAFNRVTPELGLWLQTQPGLDVRVRMLNCEDDPASLNLDIVLSSRFESSFYSSKLITSEKYIPVCTPAIYQQLSTNEQVLQ